MVGQLMQHLLTVDFWEIAFFDFASALGATFGTLSPDVPLVLTAFFGIFGWAMARRSWLVACASISVLGTSVFLSMLDTVNTTPNYMGQFTYYYHSPVALLAVFWAATAYAWLRPSNVAARAVAVVMVIAVTLLNLANFQRVNEILKIIHTFPLAQLEPRVFDPTGLTARFEALLDSGPLPQASAFRRQLENYRKSPMGDKSYADRLERAYRKD
jgi:hypothetical protein